MTTSDLRSRSSETETPFLETLRVRYEDEGFTFTAHPEDAQLPDFLRGYSPDAIARKTGRNIAIEVKRRRDASTDRSLRATRRLFEGHPDWKFQIVFAGADPSQSLFIPVADPEVIQRRVREVRSLAAQGQFRAAFAMAWSLLEAALRASRDGLPNGPLSSATVVQTLAMDGLIDPALENKLRALADVRNRIMHGDLLIEPDAADVELVLSAIEQTLSPNSP